MPKNGIILQWGWTEMEELLQCPICLEPPTGIVEQCQHGHHICSKCKPKVENCPLCKCRYEGTRNFVVEELVRHFDVIKNTMMLNSIAEESSGKKKAKTKLNAAAPFTPKKYRFRRPLPTPKCTKGEYPCRVGDCSIELPLSRILNHVRTFHPAVLTEAVVDECNNFSHTWEEQYKPGKFINTISRVFFVSGIGLVFFNLEILRTGDTIAYLRLASKFAQAQKFVGTVELFNDAHNVSFKSRLVSVRENNDGMLQKRLCFTAKKFTMRSVCHDKKFNCKISISRYVDNEEITVNINEMEQVNFITGLRASILCEQEKAKSLREFEKDNSNKSSQKRNSKKNEHNSQGHGSSTNAQNVNSNASTSLNVNHWSEEANVLLRRLKEVENSMNRALRNANQINVSNGTSSGNSSSNQSKSRNPTIVEIATPFFEIEPSSSNSNQPQSGNRKKNKKKKTKGRNNS